MELVMDYLGQFAAGVATLSLGSVFLIIYSVAKYFKKGDFVLSLFNNGKTSANKIFGEDNVTDFLAYAKNIKVKDLKDEVLQLKEELTTTKQGILILLKIFAANGALDDLEELKEEIDKLL